jgi:hypothetical protein
LLGCLAKERAIVREMEVISKTWRLRGLVAGEIQCHWDDGPDELEVVGIGIGMMAGV